MINFNLLRIFHTVAVTGSVVRAAYQLHISQPAVSNGLKKLQDEFNIALFKRKRRNLVLTKDGEELLSYTKSIFSIEKDIELFLDNIKKKNNHIHLGLVTLYERSGVGDIIDIFKSINSDIVLSIHSGNTMTTLRELADGNIDIAIAGPVKNLPHLTRFFYKEHTVFLIVPKGHRLFGAQHFTSDDLVAEKILLKEAGSAVRTVINEYLEKNAVNINTAIELSNFDSMLEMMKHSGGIAFFPDDIISHLSIDPDMFSTLSPAEGSLSFSTWLYIRNIHSYPESLRGLIKKLARTFSAHSPQGGQPPSHKE